MIVPRARLSELIVVQPVLVLTNPASGLSQNDADHAIQALQTQLSRGECASYALQDTQNMTQKVDPDEDPIETQSD